MAQDFGTRFPCGWRVHHPERMDADAIDGPSCRSWTNCLGRVVSRSVPAALPDVLGRTPGLSPFALRRTARTCGRSHHPEPAGAAVHRYPDELHVSQRRLVVFLHVDPILCDLSPALLDCAPYRAIGIFVDWMCRRIFCAVRFARAVATKRLMGPGRFCNLSIAGICPRYVAGNVAQAIASPFGMDSPSRRGIRRRSDSLSRGAAALPRPLSIYLCRFCDRRLLYAGDCGDRRIDFAVQLPR